jgi:TRAP-type uncharacterized transport system substrate-binding protein
MGTVKQDIGETIRATWETVVDELSTWLRFVREMWLLFGLLFIVLSLTVWYARPVPPRHVVMGTGSVGGSYEVLTKRYAQYFAKHGITLELVNTPGAQDNIARLKDKNDPMMAALIQGGLTSPEDAKRLLSLGSVDYEPIWFFYRKDIFDERTLKTADFFAKPMAVGAPGSGTHAQAMHVIKLNEITDTCHLLEIPSNEGVAAYLRGEASSIFIVDGIESENVQALLSDNRSSLANFNRAAAYARQMPFFHVLEIPRGSFNLAQDFPSRDTQMIGVTTNLVIDPNLHPAIQILFLRAAREINGGRNFFAHYREFPAFKESDIPESDVAEKFYRDGEPWLMNYFPFWLAIFINHIVLLLIPVAAFAYPIMKEVPGYRLARARRRMNEVYGKLKGIEQTLFSQYDTSHHQEYLDQLQEIEIQTVALKVPRSLTSDYFSLRSNIDYVNAWLERKKSSAISKVTTHEA